MQSVTLKLTKQKLERMVNLYKILHKSDYQKVCKMLVLKRENIKKEGRLNSKIIKRAILEYPEDLLDMIEAGLDKQEFIWFRSVEGAKYFGKICPEFLLVSKL